MMKYLKANMSITTNPLINSMKVSHKAIFKVSDKLEIGMGWHIKSQENIIWHNGGTDGFISFIGFDKKKNAGVVILTNSALEKENSVVDDRIDIAGFNILKSL